MIPGSSPFPQSARGQGTGIWRAEMKSLGCSIRILAAIGAGDPRPPRRISASFPELVF